MNRKLLFVCVFIFMAIQTMAIGNTVRDSLIQQLQVKTITVEQKLKLYDELLMHLTSTEKTSVEQYAQEAIAFAQLKNQKKFESSYRISYGMSLYFKGMMDRCLEEYLKALHLAETVADKKLSSRVLHEMGVFYNKNGMRDKGIDAIEKSIALARDINDTNGIARSLNSLGALYEKNNEFDEALKCYVESLEKYTLLKDDLGKSYSYSNIGLIYLYQFNYTAAKKNLEASLKLRLQLNDINAIAMSYVDLAELSKSQKKYNEAIQFAMLSISKAKKVNYQDIIQYSYQLISACYASLNEFDKAYQYNVLHINLKDSLFNIKRSEQIAEMQVKYETEKKEQQIKIQSLEISRRNTYLMVSLAIFIIVLIVIYLMYNRYKLSQANRIQQEIIKQQDLASKAIIEAEENERKRIAGDLHDGIGQLFSAVKMNLSGLADRLIIDSESDKLLYDKTIAMVDESCSEVRSISHNMMPNVLLKYGLAVAVRDFIDKIDASKLKIYLEIDGLNINLDSSTETVMYRVIQESVNNVIKHSGANRLDIQISNDDGGTSLSIEDNGKGFDTSIMEQFEGIGLKNMKTRVALIKGFIEWDSSIGKGTLVSIFIPNIEINNTALPS